MLNFFPVEFGLYSLAHLTPPPSFLFLRDWKNAENVWEEIRSEVKRSRSSFTESKNQISTLNPAHPVLYVYLCGGDGGLGGGGGRFSAAGVTPLMNLPRKNGQKGRGENEAENIQRNDCGKCFLMFVLVFKLFFYFDDDPAL